MVTAGRFVNDDGEVDWGGLALALFGSAFLAVITGLINGILAFFGIFTAAIDGVVVWAVGIVDTLFAGSGAALLAAWSSARAVMTESEAFGFVVALGLILAVLWAGQRVISA